MTTCQTCGREIGTKDQPIYQPVIARTPSQVTYGPATYCRDHVPPEA